MIITCDPTSGSVAMLERDVFTSFSVEVPIGSDLAAVSRLLGTPEPDQADHVWVSVAQLKQLAGDTTAEWDGNLDEMLDYAATKGWVSDGRDMVLAHVEPG